MTTPAKQAALKPARKAASDYTGRLTELQNAEKASEVKEAANRMAMVQAAQAELKETIIDLSDVNNPVKEVQVRKVEVNAPYRIIRTNTTLNQVTFGRKVEDPGDIQTGRPPIMGPMVMYNLEEGQPYKVPKDFAEHLNSKGYLSYMSNA